MKVPESDHTDLGGLVGRLATVGLSSSILVGIIVLLINPKHPMLDGRLLRLSIGLGIVIAAVDQACLIAGKHYRQWSIDHAEARRAWIEAEGDRHQLGECKEKYDALSKLYKEQGDELIAMRAKYEPHKLIGNTRPTDNTQLG